MHLTHLSLTNYRAFTRLDMDVPRRILLLVGDNAQGKTSILEAVYFLATFTSFHAQHDRQIINFGVSTDALAVARIVADYQRADHHHRLELRLIQEGNGNGGVRLRKEILLDGVKRSPQTALGHFNAVIFTPQMMHIIEGGPEERRRYINLALAQTEPGYAKALSEYNQLLSQRNALLKLLGERSGDLSQLVYWDDLISRRGAAIIHWRIQAIQQLEHIAVRIHHQLSHSQEVLRFDYQPSYDPLPKPNGQYMLPLQTTVERSGFSEEQIRQGFLDQLAVIRREEIARGVTTIGPHRDELRILSNRIDLGDYGSRGQVRTAILALKLAEVIWMKERTGQWPVLLLDEIMAELDIQRRADLLAYLENCEQVMLTTTDLNLFDGAFVDRNTTWQVTGGRVNASMSK